MDSVLRLVNALCESLKINAFGLPRKSGNDQMRRANSSRSLKHRVRSVQPGRDDIFHRSIRARQFRVESTENSDDPCTEFIVFVVAISLCDRIRIRGCFVDSIDGHVRNGVTVFRRIAAVKGLPVSVQP